MELKSFQVKNYRSVNDSGLIDVKERTALVGRNESGKTNLLHALASLNPAGKDIEDIDEVKNFPNDRPLSDYSDDLELVTSDWVLSQEEREEVNSFFQRSVDIEEISITRPYGARREIVLTNFDKLQINEELITNIVSETEKSLKSSKKGKEESTKQKIDQTIEEIEKVLLNFELTSSEWSEKAKRLVQSIEERFDEDEFAFSDHLKENLEKLSAHAQAIEQDISAEEKTEKWVLDNMPSFIYLEDYPFLDGYQNIKRYLENPPPQTPKKAIEKEAEKNFGKLLKVAGLDARQLHTLLESEHQKRQQLVNRAGAVVTRKLRELWKDRKLKVRFDVDAQHFKTLVSDDGLDYDVEINLNERSKGFKWFFSFYVTFAADTQSGEAKEAILLLDEPGLFLHATGQKDLLAHFKNDFENQIIYTTHSPFMIPVDDLTSIRTVNTSTDEGTTVTNDPSGDEQTIFPLKSAIGYEIAQSMFIQERNLAVEGVTDYWYLTTVSTYLSEAGRSHLPENLAIIPSGSAQNIPYMTSLLSGQKLQVIVLFDREPKASQEAEKLIKSKLIRDEFVIFCDQVFKDPKPNEADIEDLLDQGVFESLVREAYREELKDVELTPNEHIPRICVRYDKAFEKLGIPFNKSRVAKLFMMKVADDPESVMTDKSIDRFDRLFALVNEKLEKIDKVDRQPFN